MRQSKRMTMVLALLLSVIGADVFAQKGADSVWVDSVEVDSVALAEEFKSDYDSEEDKARMDSLIQSRYVIVSMNGKYGIYDREKNDSVTAVDTSSIPTISNQKTVCASAISTMRKGCNAEKSASI